MKTTPAIILNLTRPNGQPWCRVRIGRTHWQHLERRAKSLGMSVLGLILDQSERRAA
jgi:hypothetical protein